MNIDFENDENHEKAMLIFTPTVNGRSGCNNVTNSLKEKFKTTVACYNGSMKSKEKEKKRANFTGASKLATRQTPMYTYITPSGSKGLYWGVLPKKDIFLQR